MRRLICSLLCVSAALFGELSNVESAFLAFAEQVLGKGNYVLKGAGDGLFGGVSGDPTCRLCDRGGEPLLILKGFIDNPEGFTREKVAAQALNGFKPRLAVYPQLRGEAAIDLIGGQTMQLLAFTFWQGVALDQLRSDSKQFFEAWEKYGAAVAELGKLKGERIGKVDEKVAEVWRRWAASAKEYLDGVDVVQARLERFLSREHRLGISHGDIHSGNVILMKNGQIGLIDFSETWRTLDGGGFLGSDFSQGQFMAIFDDQPDACRSAFRRGYEKAGGWVPEAEDVELFSHLFAYWWIDWYLERQQAGRLAAEVDGVLDEWVKFFQEKGL